MERKRFVLILALVLLGTALVVGVVLFLRARALPENDGGWFSPSRPVLSGSSATSVAPFIPLKDTPSVPGYNPQDGVPTRPVNAPPQPPQTNPSSRIP